MTVDSACEQPLEGTKLAPIFSRYRAVMSRPAGRLFTAPGCPTNLGSSCFARSSAGVPQAAVVGFAVTDQFEIVFDTL